MSHCSNCSHHEAHNHESISGVSGGFKIILRRYIREIVSGVMLVIGTLLKHFHIFPDTENEFPLIEFVWYMVAVLPVAIPIMIDTIQTWRKGDFLNEFTLMVLAAVGAFYIKEFPEGVAVLLFYSFGEKMEHSASDDVRERIRRLIGRLPDKAFVVEDDGRLKAVDPQSVMPGTILMVRPGERVPVDGILQGSPIDFDTSAITGESVPRTYVPGEEVVSGMIPIDRGAMLKTVRAFADSSMSRMMRLIEEAASKKSHTESMLRRITRWYTPVVMCLALLIFFVPYIVSLFPGASPFEATVWLRRALVFLVCSCPCALVVSIPLSYFASMGSASRFGLLFKDSAHLDSMRRVDTMVFDKTGTLTTGRFSVKGISSSGSFNADQILGLCAAVDSESSHPLAQAIVEEAKHRQLVLPDVTDITSVPHGVHASLAGNEEILVGSRRLMEENKVAMSEHKEPYTEVCVAIGGKYAGSVFLEDSVKPEAVATVDNLRKSGVRHIWILSGDREEAVGGIARQIGADSWRSQLLPSDKQRIIGELQSDGYVVAFVGDGVNDAPALTAADVGVAIGGHGTDMAMESADMVVAGDDLSVIPDAIRLSEKVRRVVVENIVFAFGVKAAVMILGALGIATLWAAVFADTGVTVITILWTIICLVRVKPRKTERS